MYTLIMILIGAVAIVLMCVRIIIDNLEKDIKELQRAVDSLNTFRQKFKI